MYFSYLHCDPAGWNTVLSSQHTSHYRRNAGWFACAAYKFKTAEAPRPGIGYTYRLIFELCTMLDKEEVCEVAMLVVVRVLAGGYDINWIYGSASPLFLLITTPTVWHPNDLVLSSQLIACETGR